ncbi:MAG: hypothetical protein K9L61_00740 [Candidatus Omnitrophica bacterium]|nr:hypothetical protein [Candidatus Omnitrophota bacterium]
MIIKKINQFQAYLIFIFGVILILILFHFVYCNLKANQFYNKAVGKEELIIVSEKINYYNQVIDLLSKAIIYNKGNAKYYAKKADYLFDVSQEGLSQKINSKDNPDYLYKKAIQLNPADFEYHLRLGWFYAQINQNEAIKELKKAIKLYPVNYQSYLYLAKYYIKIKNNEAAFSNLLSAIYYSNYRKIYQRVKNDFQSLSNLYFQIWRPRFLKLIIIPNKDKIDLSQKGFPHLAIPMTIKIYVKNNLEMIDLYKNSYFFDSFKLIETKGEKSIYQLKLDPEQNNYYLDDLIIKNIPIDSVEKIEFIRYF